MNKIFNFLLITGILITPFLNIGEIYALFTGALENQTTVYTNYLIKGLTLLQFGRHRDKTIKIYNKVN